MTELLRQKLENRELTRGAGKLSAFLSISLGILGILAALCFLFPNLLTTPEFRPLYNTALLRQILIFGIALGFISGVISTLRNLSRRWGLFGMLLNALAALLASGQIEPVYHGRSVYAGLDYFVLTLLIAALIFIPMERFFAKYNEQKLLRTGWVTDLKYFMFSHIGLQLISFFTIIPAQMMFNQWLNPTWQQMVSSQPLVLQFIEILIIVDFFSYWIHRSMHKVPRLWRIHAVHHSSHHMDWLAASRVHVFEIIMNRFVGYIPLLFMGFSPAATYAYLVFISFHAIFIHANVKFRFPGFRWVLATPEFHHWHHSSEKEALDINFAAFLPMYDVLFKTAHMPAHLPTRYGTTAETKVPDGFIGQFLYPLKRRKRKKKQSSNV
jgi:sterol desaturase/sphingolipid hydroxylase (fatty acid hydroxylase superfamily)